MSGGAPAAAALAALLFAPAVGAPPAVPSGEAAVGRVKSLLAALGVRGRLRLQALSSMTVPGARSRTVTVTDPRGNAYTAYVGRGGRVASLHRGSERDVLGGRKPRSLVGTGHESRVRRWLAAVGAGETTRLASLTGDDKGVGRATFRVLRLGHPFVSHPPYEYGFAFAVKTGEFLAFRAPEAPPPVDPRPPKLDKKQALAAFKRVWDAQEAAASALGKRRWLRTWYTLTDQPELGYFLPESRREAILVWKVRFLDYRDVGHAIQMGSNAMLIDAITGERVPTRTVP